MTAASTALALGFMPLNLWIYSRSWTSRTTAVPYVRIVITLVTILIPTAAGMVIRWKKPTAARIIIKVKYLENIKLNKRV